jgi:Ca-activated chloride channel family protein
MGKILLSFLLMLSASTHAQVQFNTENHQFGQLLSSSQRYVDISVKNIGSKPTLIFSVRKSKEVSSLISKKRIHEDSTSTIRLQVNPKKTGPFEYKIEVFTSDQNEPTIVTLSGDMVEYDASSNHLFTACPSFSSQPLSDNPQAFKLTIVTVDKVTKKELSQSSVTLIQKGIEVWTDRTDKKGEVKRDASLGISYFVAERVGYLPTEKGQYINFKRNLIVLELEQDTAPDLSKHLPESITELNKKSEVQEATVLVPVPENDQVIEKKSKRDNQVLIPDKKETHELIDSNDSHDNLPLLSELEKDNFDSEHFKAINTVFVLDISSSMRQADKIELMKYSLIQLSKMLRPQDRFSIVSYASNSKVVLPSTQGDSTTIIQEAIQDLEARGFTSGSKGIKLGYETATLSTIQTGANHVIVITDGAFNQDSKGYLKHIKRYKRKGITLSVVGIKCKTKEEEELQKVAKLGGGRFARINKLSDAQQNLKQEIRRASFKN